MNYTGGYIFIGVSLETGGYAITLTDDWFQRWIDAIKKLYIPRYHPHHADILLLFSLSIEWNVYWHAIRWGILILI